MDFLQNNLGLFGLAVISGVMLLWTTFGGRLSGVKEVDSVGAVQLMNHRDALVLDVREDKEVAAGRIPNSKHIPLGQLASRLQELTKYKEKPVVISCRSGARSASACRTLAKSGFTEVYNLKGGILAWEQANMPVERK
ncbi:rhodanese-related sulfurtransferase [Sulfurirhabdus autotrophica]|uniref:Rhodanese-related sulfurtransferase n=1 Tax=Sulfurirhabdus autotrophica TaxID=1706046 RepID=A0A4R3Y197_9PROT|nr:rhodanese-like domain-containing protein [Sulfurirhabdus autotrophica]TCV85202.1 rhodanese-related sulfurtransferase [Sulfurirhabdus autotrophica]